MSIARGEIGLPPLLTPHVVVAQESGADADVLRWAGERAARGELGAGDAVLMAAPFAAGMAIVLEPEVDAATARQMAPLMMVALADSLGSLLPPKVAVEHLWPGSVLINGAPGADVRLVMAEAARDESGRPSLGDAAPPDWLVVAARVHMAFADDAPEPGQMPGRTTLSEEGGGEITVPALFNSLGAHFMTWLDVWQTDGFERIAQQWLFRAHGREQPMTIAGIDGTGGMLQGEAGRVYIGRVLGLDEGSNLRFALESGGEVLLDYAAASRGAMRWERGA